MVKEPVVYLTQNKAYALFYIIDKEINWVTYGMTEQGIIRYDEQFPDQISKLYKGVSGYIYKCFDNGFFKMTSTRDVWISKSPVTVNCAEYIHDVYSEIISYEQSGAININCYEALTSERKQDIRDMMIHYIFKNDILGSSSKKAAFIQENFPYEWNEVHTHPEKRQIILDEWDKKRNNPT